MMYRGYLFSFWDRVLSFEYQEVGETAYNQLIRKAGKKKNFTTMSSGVYGVGARRICCENSQSEWADFL